MRLSGVSRYSHLRPVLVHMRQEGRPSSHFLCRALKRPLLVVCLLSQSSGEAILASVTARPHLRATCPPAPLLLCLLTCRQLGHFVCFYCHLQQMWHWQKQTTGEMRLTLPMPASWPQESSRDRPITSTIDTTIVCLFRGAREFPFLSVMDLITKKTQWAHPLVRVCISSSFQESHGNGFLPLNIVSHR